MLPPPANHAPRLLNLESKDPTKTPSGPTTNPGPYSDWHVPYNYWLKWWRTHKQQAIPHELLPHLKNKQYVPFCLSGTVTRKAHNLTQAIQAIRKLKTIYLATKIFNPKTGNFAYLIRGLP
jgi:hypothetical protein